MINVKTPEQIQGEKIRDLEEIIIELTGKVRELEKFVLTLDDRISKAEITKAKNGAAIRSLESSVRVIEKRLNKEI